MADRGARLVSAAIPLSLTVHIISLLLWFPLNQAAFRCRRPLAGGATTPFRRRCPCTPLGKCAVTDAFFRSGPSGTGISEKSTRRSTRRKRPHVGRQYRSQKPVATATDVAAT